MPLSESELRQLRTDLIQKANDVEDYPVVLAQFETLSPEEAFEILTLAGFKPLLTEASSVKLRLLINAKLSELGVKIDAPEQPDHDLTAALAAYLSTATVESAGTIDPAAFAAILAENEQAAVEAPTASTQPDRMDHFIQRIESVTQSYLSREQKLAFFINFNQSNTSALIYAASEGQDAGLAATECILAKLTSLGFSADEIYDCLMCRDGLSNTALNLAFFCDSPKVAQAMLDFVANLPLSQEKKLAFLDSAFYFGNKAANLSSQHKTSQTIIDHYRALYSQTDAATIFAAYIAHCAKLHKEKTFDFSLESHFAAHKKSSELKLELTIFALNLATKKKSKLLTTDEKTHLQYQIDAFLALFESDAKKIMAKLQAFEAISPAFYENFKEVILQAFKKAPRIFIETSPSEVDETSDETNEIDDLDEQAEQYKIKAQQRRAQLADTKSKASEPWLDMIQATPCSLAERQKLIYFARQIYASLLQYHMLIASNANNRVASQFISQLFLVLHKLSGPEELMPVDDAPQSGTTAVSKIDSVEAWYNTNTGTENTPVPAWSRMPARAEYDEYRNFAVAFAAQTQTEQASSSRTTSNSASAANDAQPASSSRAATIKRRFSNVVAKVRTATSKPSGAATQASSSRTAPISTSHAFVDEFAPAAAASARKTISSERVTTLDSSPQAASSSATRGREDSAQLRKARANGFGLFLRK